MPETLFLVVGVVSRNYKTNNLLLVQCKYRYIFSFTLKLTTTEWNERQKENGMDQNLVHCGYGNYYNQQTYIYKTCLHDFASLSCHIVFKDLSKLIICYWISLKLARASQLEI